jgi:hypothetical protein
LLLLLTRIATADIKAIAAIAPAIKIMFDNVVVLLSGWVEEDIVDSGDDEAGNGEEVLIVLLDGTFPP